MNEVIADDPTSSVCGLRDLLYAVAYIPAAFHSLQPPLRPNRVSPCSMKHQDFCLRARLLSLISGTAHFVYVSGQSYAVSDNPPAFADITYVATAKHQHPLEA